jgi:hypothetical protein
MLSTANLARELSARPEAWAPRPFQVASRSFQVRRACPGCTELDDDQEETSSGSSGQSQVAPADDHKE